VALRSEDITATSLVGVDMKEVSKPFVVIFAGAGASKAVNGQGYPTTVEFFDNLPPTITNNKLFDSVMDYLRLGNSKIDIEVVLWALQELNDQLSVMGNNRSLLGWLMATNRLGKWRGSDTPFASVIQEASITSSEVGRLVSDIDERVYELYRRPPEVEEIKENWLLLLAILKRIGSHVEIVTTNYDVVIETVIDILSDQSAKIDSGWRGSIYRKLDLSLWLKSPSPGDQGLLTKLHGSVNWARDGSEVQVGDPYYRGSHDRHAIIYPGFKGRPKVEPFVSLHRYFSDCVAMADMLIFIGFGFRDEYINEICDRSVRQQAAIVVINPAAMPEIPWLKRGNVHHLKVPFSRDSMESLNKIILE